MRGTPVGQKGGERPRLVSRLDIKDKIADDQDLRYGNPQDPGCCQDSFGARLGVERVVAREDDCEVQRPDSPEVIEGGPDRSKAVAADDSDLDAPHAQELKRLFRPRIGARLPRGLGFKCIEDFKRLGSLRLRRHAVDEFKNRAPFGAANCAPDDTEVQGTGFGKRAVEIKQHGSDQLC